MKSSELRKVLEVLEKRYGDLDDRYIGIEDI